MTDDELNRQIEECLKSLPKELEVGEIVSLLCTIAAGYAEEEEGAANMAPYQGIHFLELALGLMTEIREASLEKSASILQ